jgi:parallel beta-helix repeat protein
LTSKKKYCDKKATSNRGKAVSKYGLAIAIVAILAGSFVVIPGAQAAVVTVFEDDVEAGVDGWTNASLWHITERRCSSTSHSWWYGQEATGNYDTGGHSLGCLVSPSIDLTGATAATLYYWTWWQTESDASYDTKRVYITTDGGTTWNLLEQLPAGSGSGNRTLDLAIYKGNVVQIRFCFDTKDDYYNNYEGWFVDDIKVEKEVPTMPDLNITEKSEEWVNNIYFNVNYTVKNIGNATAGASNTTIYINGTPHEDPVPALDVSESYTSTVGPFECPCDTTGVNVTVCADNGNVVEESDDTNNCMKNWVTCNSCVTPIHVNTTGWWRKDGAFNASGTPVQSAINNANDGDTIIVEEGTYKGSVDVNKELTLMAASRPVIDANGDTYAVWIQADNSTLEGFEIINATQVGGESPGVGVNVAGWFPPSTFPHVENVIIRNCSIHDNNFGIVTRMNNSEIIENNISSNDEGTGVINRNCSCDAGGSINCTAKWTEGGAVVISGVNNTISDNTVEYNGAGIVVFCDSNNTLIQDNIVKNNSDGTVNMTCESGSQVVFSAIANGTGIGMFACSNTNILSNVFADNGEYGIGIWNLAPCGTSANNVIDNNSIYGHTKYGVYRNETPAVDAFVNWWGDCSGPHHPTKNPMGTGDNVSDNVNFSSWFGLKTVYLDPQASNETYCHGVIVDIWVEHLEWGAVCEFKSGQINLTYNRTCANVTDYAANVTNFPTSGWTHYEGADWITFMASESSLSSGLYHIGTLTIHCNATDECATGLNFSDSCMLFDHAGCEVPTIWLNGSFACTVECGDVNFDNAIDIGDVGLLHNHVQYGVSIGNAWVADVQCGDGINMGDVGLLHNHVQYGSALNCCS